MTDDNSVGPENGNSPLGACSGTATERTCSCVQLGDSRDDGDSSCHFTCCGLGILRDKLYRKFSREVKNKKGSILSVSLGMINRAEVFIVSPYKEPQVLLKVPRKVVRKEK